MLNPSNSPLGDSCHTDVEVVNDMDDNWSWYASAVLSDVIFQLLQCVWVVFIDELSGIPIGSSQEEIDPGSGETMGSLSVLFLFLFLIILVWRCSQYIVNCAVSNHCV